MKLFILRSKQLLDVLIFGIPTTIWLLLRNPVTVYYVPHIGVGDFCFALGYLKAYKSYHHIGHITLVCSKARMELCSFYSGYDDLIALSNRQYRGFAYLASVPIGRFICRKCKRIEHTAPVLHVNRALLFDNPAIHIYDCTKMILRIPKETELFPPIVPDTDITTLIKKFRLEKDKTVLINPYTSGLSVKELDMDFYRLLAEKLNKIGFKTFTILGFPSQHSVPGTEGFVTSLAEAWYLAKYCGYVIGTRSGFFDFIQYAGCEVITIYDARYRQKDFFSIEEHNGDRQVFEYVYESDYQKLVDKIVGCVEHMPVR